MNNKDLWMGSSYHGDILLMNYVALKQTFGEPTNKHVDSKVQKEWCLQTTDGIPFTIYDWKEYNRNVEDGETVEWHIGYNIENRQKIYEYFKSIGQTLRKDSFQQYLESFNR